MAMATARRVLLCVALAARCSEAAVATEPGKCSGGSGDPDSEGAAPLDRSLMQARIADGVSVSPREALAGLRGAAARPLEAAKSAAAHLAARLLPGTGGRLLVLAKAPASTMLNELRVRAGLQSKEPQGPAGSAPPAAVEEHPGGGGAALAGGRPVDQEEGAHFAFVTGLMGSAVYIVLILCFGYLYVNFYRTEALEAGSPGKPTGIEELSKDSFRFGLCDCDGCCGRDLKICFFGLCCMGIRWADTLSQRKVRLNAGFWGLLFFATACCALDEITFGLSSFIFIVAAVMSRQRLRATFGLKHGTGGTYFKDCAVWCCCCCLAAIQEAREVEYLAVSNAV